MINRLVFGVTKKFSYNDVTSFICYKNFFKIILFANILSKKDIIVDKLHELDYFCIKLNKK